MGDEGDLETWAREESRRAGGLMLKWASPGRRGPPDNIVFWPAQVVHFLEFKAGDGRIDPLQSMFHRQLAVFGHIVKIPRDRGWVKTYIRKYAGGAREENTR